jgi:uncharacterized protein DUF2793
MSEESPRYRLPLIAPGQAQKELFHNEALLRIDAALQAAVEEGPIAGPPANPEAGQCWLAAVGATGAWTGKDGQLAMWSGSGWRFVAPAAGMTVWNKAAALPLRWSGTGASLVVGGQQVVGERQPAVPSPSGGTIIDAEARAAIDALIAALMSHGLID